MDASEIERNLRPEGHRSVGPSLGPDPEARGRELVEALELAAEFPARHRQHLEAPRFGRVHTIAP